MIQLKNNAQSMLAYPVSAADTTLTVIPEDMARFPNLAVPGDHFYCAVADSQGNLEFVKVTGSNTQTATLTVVRGAEGTTPRGWNTGDRVQLRMSMATWTDMAGDWWQRVKTTAGDALAPALVSTSSFSLSGDWTGEMQMGRRLRITASDGTLFKGHVASATLADGVTTVTVGGDPVPSLSGTLVAVDMGFSTEMESHLAKIWAGEAEASKTAASQSEISAGASALAAASSESNAKASETAAEASKTAAATSETNAKASETSALASKNAAAASEANAKTSETNAAASKTSAANSAATATSKATAAGNSASAALASQNVAKTSETNAAGSASTATAKASAAATSAAEALASKNAAGTSAATATTKAAEASTSAASASTSATQAANDATRAETAANNAEAIVGGNYVVATRKVIAGAGLSGGGDLTADRTLAVEFGTTAGTACQGDDARLSNARTPTGHAASHQHGGTDEIATATPAANAIPKADATGKLQKGWFPAALTLIGDLVALDTDVFPSGDEVKILPVEGRGLYFFDAYATDTPDGESILKPQTGTGRWRLLVPSAELIASELGAAVADLGVYARKTDAALAVFSESTKQALAGLESDVQVLDSRTLYTRSTVAVGSVSSNASKSITVSFPGVSVGDVLAVTASVSVSGIIFSGLVTGADTAVLTTTNITAASVTVAAQEFVFFNFCAGKTLG